MKKRFWRVLELKLSCLLLFIMFIFVYCSGSLYWIVTQNSLAESRFTERDKCPACFGESLCKAMARNQIRLSTFSHFAIYEQTIHRAIFNNKRQSVYVILKRLATRQAFTDLQARICSKNKMAPDCDIATATKNLDLVRNRDAFLQSLHGLSSTMLYCPSTRLVDVMLSKYREGTADAHRMYAQIWTTANINAEPLLLQTFPAKDGWPFPTYHGACGRFVVEDDDSTELSYFYNAPWNKRVNLALQLVQLADKLTHNKDDFALYMLDVSYRQFGVTEAGDVKLIDLKEVLVVDKQAVKSAKPKKWSEIHESPFNDCSEHSYKQCQATKKKELCSYVTSDHNYYVICRNILSRVDNTGSNTDHVDGLLHDMPEVAKNDWDLEYLLSECVMPQRQRGRIQVVHKLIEALTNLQS